MFGPKLGFEISNTLAAMQCFTILLLAYALIYWLSRQLFISVARLPQEQSC